MSPKGWLFLYLILDQSVAEVNKWMNKWAPSTVHHDQNWKPCTVCFLSVCFIHSLCRGAQGLEQITEGYGLNHRLKPIASTAQPKISPFWIIPCHTCNPLHLLKGFPERSVPLEAGKHTGRSGKDGINKKSIYWLLLWKCTCLCLNVCVSSCMTHRVRGAVCSVFILSRLVSLTGWHPAVHEPGREGGQRGCVCLGDKCISGDISCCGDLWMSVSLWGLWGILYMSPTDLINW